MKILIIFAGGTIGSTVKGNYISIDTGKPSILMETYRKRYGMDFEYETRTPYMVLSENNTGKNYVDLVNCILDNINDGYDGIIVAHGTDTLQYSASVLTYALGNNTIPICIVSSNHPIEDPRANGLINLHGAINFIRQKAGKGSFVIYKNGNDTVTKVHRANRLRAGYVYTDRIDSIFDMPYGHFDENDHFVANDDFVDFEGDFEPIGRLNIGPQCDFIYRIYPYVGMVYPKFPKSVKYVLLDSFHSGTIDTASDAALSFYEYCKEKGIKVFITGLGREVSYESTKKYLELGITPLYNISPISAYIKGWLYGKL
ncbi:MAG: asparaginase [Clostridia bacterium]|nr:asparaginase [Clostridia bacterium]